MKSLIFIWAALLIAFGSQSVVAKDKNIKDVSLDEIVAAPDRFQDPVRVKGVVVNGRNAKNVFMLGCEDACFVMPVQYKGRLPALKSKVAVYGIVKKQPDGRYIFQAAEIKAQ